MIVSAGAAIGMSVKTKWNTFQLSKDYGNIIIIIVGHSPGCSVSVLQLITIRLRTIVGHLQLIGLVQKALILFQTHFQLIQFVLGFVQLTLNGHRIAQRGVCLINNFHLHQTIAGVRLLVDLMLQLGNFRLQLFALLIRWQIAKVLLLAVRS